MSKPDWLPEPPEGWDAWHQTYYQDWRSERGEDFAWICVRVETVGPTVSAGYAGGSRQGEMCRFVGHTLDSLRRACIAMGLRDWIERREPTVARQTSGPPERPRWAPPCPAGWHDSPDHRGGWRVKGPRVPGTNHDYHLRLTDGSDGATSLLHGSRGDTHVAITSAAEFYLACRSVGLTEWLPETHDQRLDRALRELDAKLAAMTDDELLAELNALAIQPAEAEGTERPDAPGLWLYSDGMGLNCARVCLDGDALVAQVPGVAGFVPVAEMDVDWLEPVGEC